MPLREHDQNPSYFLRRKSFVHLKIGVTVSFFLCLMRAMSKECGYPYNKDALILSLIRRNIASCTESVSLAAIVYNIVSDLYFPTYHHYSTCPNPIPLLYTGGQLLKTDNNRLYSA
ncbi:hypothetical protein HNY73_015905 [Argiope bruennichi]|uniref:Uncharacterized protein n=1 Tax=Argiope bruennichi TaxID=94029 RepID=A0A8T0EH72_ARGBR|nr:hypothetical protein HNY73_015905 [Argiope bruennichi]